MMTLDHARSAPALVLSARTAADLMTPNPVSIRHAATVPEAAAFLTTRGISAAPVIDEAGRPVGVVSRTDVLQHQGQRAVYLMGSPGYCELPEAASRALVREVMTPVVFCVEPETPAAKVVEKMLALGVRRLFVVDGGGVLVGVISATDVLGKLRRWGPDQETLPGASLT